MRHLSCSRLSHLRHLMQVHHLSCSRLMQMDPTVQPMQRVDPDLLVVAHRSPAQCPMAARTMAYSMKSLGGAS